MKKTQIIFRVAPEKKKQLQIKAINENTTVQALLEKAVGDLIGKGDGK